MMGYMTMINAVFALLIVGAMIFTRHGVTPEFLLNLLFYIIITPIITVTLNKIMYSSENEMVVTDALQRMDAIFQSAPLPVADQPKTAKDASIELDHVTFAYQNTEKNVLRDISMTIPAGSHVALVGPSGSGKSTLLRTLAGIFSADEGIVDMHGYNVSLLSIGVGFQKELSGRENIYLSGMLLGFKEEEIKKKAASQN